MISQNCSLGYMSPLLQHRAIRCLKVLRLNPNLEVSGMGRGVVSTD